MSGPITVTITRTISGLLWQAPASGSAVSSAISLYVYAYPSWAAVAHRAVLSIRPRPLQLTAAHGGCAAPHSGPPLALAHLTPGWAISSSSPMAFSIDSYLQSRPLMPLYSNIHHVRVHQLLANCYSSNSQTSLWNLVIKNILYTGVLS